MKELRFSEIANFQPKQEEAMRIVKNPLCKYFLYGGAGGGGKSYFLRWSALNLSLYYFQKYGLRNVPIGIFSEDYPTLKDRQVSKIKKEFPMWLGELKSTQNEGLAFYLNDEYGGGRLLLRNLDDPSKYASTEFSAIFVEELTKNVEETFDDLRFRLRYPGIEEVKFVGATNPGQIGHGWVKRKFITKDGDDPEVDRFFFLPANVHDNKYIGEDYVKQLEALPEAKKQALLYGSWDVFEGQFFTEWNQGKHVIEPRYALTEIPDNFEMRLSWDEGTLMPRSVHLLVQDNDGRVEVVYEYYKAGETASEAAYNIKQELIKLGCYDQIKRNGKFVYDPSMDIRNNQTGKPTSAVVAAILDIPKQAANNNRLEGARRYREYLRWDKFTDPLLRIWNTNKHLIRTLPELVYADNNEEDINTKGEDHAYDDTRYGLMSFTRLPQRLGQLGTSRWMPKEPIKYTYKPRSSFNF